MPRQISFTHDGRRSTIHNPYAAPRARRVSWPEHIAEQAFNAVRTLAATPQGRQAAWDALRETGRTVHSTANSLYNRLRGARSHQRTISGRSRSSNAVRSDSTRSVTRPTVRRTKRKKRIEFKTGKKRKGPTRKFARKVKKCLDRHVTGWYRHLNTGSVPLPSDSFQTVNHFGGRPGGIEWTGYCFHPEDFLDAVSVLWNEKPASVGSHSISSVGTMGNAIPIVPGTNFNNLKFTVIAASESYLCHNVTQRDLHVKVYICAPKRISTSAIAAVPGTGAVISNISALRNPEDDWESSLVIDHNNQVSQGVVAFSKNAIKACPTDSLTWKKNWAYELKEFVLAPGQSFTVTVPGPKNLQIDMAKHWQNGTFMDVQKYVRFPMFVVYPDLASTTTQAYGRPAPLPGIANALVVERRKYYKFGMPEAAGFVSPGVFAPGATQLGLRHGVYFYQDWTPAITGTAVDYLSVNPDNPEG